MRTDALDGNDLDYWCARALCADDEDTLRFTAVAPHLVVTAACDALRRLDTCFVPSTSWSDAGAVLDRVDDLRIARHGDDVECDATFVDGPCTCGAHGRDARVALLRAFVRARAATPACRFPKPMTIVPRATARISARCRACKCMQYPAVM
ncbi:DUF2591 family protein [Burkholderia sp. AU45274]|nr:phage protein NinX family protein [Burkholderia sp. AU45274]MDN7488735.1 DUF2591 family protein [Burkholderia sp. AU45274]